MLSPIEYKPDPNETNQYSILEHIPEGNGSTT